MGYYWGLFANAQVPGSWTSELKNTDFLKKSVDFSEIFSSGPPKNDIPSIDKSKFIDFADERAEKILDRAPVIGVIINGKARAYPMVVLTWHKIVNVKLGGIPITVTYCHCAIYQLFLIVD